MKEGSHTDTPSMSRINKTGGDFPQQEQNIVLSHDSFNQNILPSSTSTISSTMSSSTMSLPRVSTPSLFNLTQDIGHTSTGTGVRTSNLMANTTNNSSNTWNHSAGNLINPFRSLSLSPLPITFKDLEEKSISSKFNPDISETLIPVE